jgi:hypothetical protein
MRACLALSCVVLFVFLFGSVEFFLVPLPLFVLVLLLLLVFCFRGRPTGIGRAAVCISGVERFSPTSLYKRRLCT